MLKAPSETEQNILLHRVYQHIFCPTTGLLGYFIPQMITIFIDSSIWCDCPPYNLQFTVVISMKNTFQQTPFHVNIANYREHRLH